MEHALSGARAVVDDQPIRILDPELARNLVGGEQKVAEELLSHPPGDPTGGALFFHSVEDSAPWQKQRRRTAKIGDHIYYK